MGDILLLAWPNLGRVPANFSANFDCKFFPRIVWPCFPGFRPSRAPPQTIHARNSRPNLSAFHSNFAFSNQNIFHADFLHPGETNTLTKHFVAQNRLFGGTFSALEIPSIKLCGSFVLRPFPGNEAQKLLCGREETKRRFCERVVLANVPSFQFLGSSNIKNHSLLLPG